MDADSDSLFLRPQCNQAPAECGWAAVWETDEERQSRNQSEASVS
ncbi:MAG: hypothetical protein JWN75_244 [Candidatus Saccharibacteria bacterium]|nr:hypothetical protein [Candidatus Saccharibacteria bacterium]